MTDNKKTFVVIIPGFPAGESDTACLPFQQQWALAFSRLYPGLKLEILAVEYPYHRRHYTWHDISVRSFDGQNKGGIKRWMTRRRVMGTLTELHQRSPITGILSLWYGECACVGKQFAEKHGIRHFCWLMGQDAKKENKYPKRTVIGGPGLIALSDFLQDEFGRNHGIRPQHVVPAGVDRNLFFPKNTARDIHLLAAGSLIPLKRFDIFMDVAQEVQKKIPALRARLIGAGPEQPALEKKIRATGLEQVVGLEGELGYPQVLSWMQRSRILIHPSSYEGFSGVCLEALHAGCHVISFQKAMKRDIAQWHLAASPKEMSEIAVSLLSDPGTMYTRSAEFCIEDSVKGIMRLLGE